MLGVPTVGELIIAASQVAPAYYLRSADTYPTSRHPEVQFLNRVSVEIYGTVQLDSETEISTVCGTVVSLIIPDNVISASCIEGNILDTFDRDH
jgi:hypothetical protein